MKCPECKQKIGSTNKTSIYDKVTELWFCSPKCLKTNKKKKEARLKKLVNKNRLCTGGWNRWSKNVLLAAKKSLLNRQIVSIRIQDGISARCPVMKNP